ncbi:MAG: transglycosylase domain-containing protein, partial [Actinocatenispora sp.]
MVTGLTVLAGLSVVGYAATVPLPSEPRLPQQSVLYYSDGRTVLARVGLVDRSNVPLSAVPAAVRHAVLAAEDRGFYRHGAVSARGIARSLYADAFSGAAQGASTVTQQYVRNAYLTLDRTVSRKVKEISLSVKLEHRYSKDEILERYLNAIYFGRGAYGIDAAARAYFGRPVDRLTMAQGMLLASVIKDPTNFDPAVDPHGARDRWRYVLAGMRAERWVSRARAATMRFPTTLRPVDKDLSGPDGLIAQQVERELGAHGITAQQLRTQGLRVVTTVDRVAQRAAVRTVRRQLHGRPADLHAALVAVDPATGGVRAYYGNDDGFGYYDDAAAPMVPGDVFTPLVLASAFNHGVDPSASWNGASPQQFPDRNGVPLYNPGNTQCPHCSLRTAMRRRLGTVLYRVAGAADPVRIVKDVRAAGIPARYDGVPTLVDGPDDPRPALTRPAVALGVYPVSPADLASGYATLANGGAATARHLV